MCLSRVYLMEGDSRTAIVEEASSVIESKGTVNIQTLFGEKKVMVGYCIGEVDLLKNCIVLRKMPDVKG